MKVLITGGTGFIGSHLAAFHLAQKDEVFLMDNFFKSDGAIDAEMRKLFNSPSAHFLKVDMTSPIKEARPPSLDIVYHLAAINGTKLFYEIPYQVARTNLLLTLHLLDWLEKVPVGRLLYASSSEVYADSEKVGLLKIPTEESIPVVFTQPTDDRFSYGASKFMGEFLCLRFGSQFHVPASVVRYHNIYGPRMGQKHVIPEFIGKILRRENPFAISGGSETRAFCYVGDAVKATFLVGTSAACANEIVHIGKSDEEIRIDALARQIMAQMKYTAEIVEQGRRSGSVSRRCPDTSKLQKLTGFTAVTSLPEGLNVTIEWYRRPRVKQED